MWEQSVPGSSEKRWLVEMDRAGGTCLNWGCIPTKSLLKNAEVYQLLTIMPRISESRSRGSLLSGRKSSRRSRKVADRLAGGIEMLFKKNKVDYIRGEASIAKAGVVEVTDKDGKKTEYKAAKILISTGVVAREMPGFPFNGKSVIGSKQAMVLADQPKDIIIIGAGAIGVEFCLFFQLLRHEGDPRRNASEHPPDRGYRGQRDTREIPQRSGSRSSPARKSKGRAGRTKACA